MTAALRKEIDAYGRKGARDYVRVFREPVGGRSMIRVQWREAAGRKTASFPDTRTGIAEAKAFAAGRHEAFGVPADEAPLVSLRELFTHYLTAKDGLKPNTVCLARYRWGKFELFVGKDAPAATVTRETLDRLKRHLLGKHTAPNQVRLIIEEVRRVYRWGIDRDLLPPNKVATYRLEMTRAVRDRGPKMAEFGRDDRAALIAQFDPRNARQWRGFVVCSILAYCGSRIRATLLLEWNDLDLDGDRIHWRAATDKTSRDRFQPMPAPVREAALVALGWAQSDGYTGPLVVYGAQREKRDRPWTYQAFVAQLHAAEKRAGMAPAKWKAAHAFRRGVAGDVRDLTGSDKDAADYIGDRSVRVVRDSYLLEREGRLRDIADRMSPESATTERHEMQWDASAIEAPETQPVANPTLGEEPAVGIEPTTA